MARQVIYWSLWVAFLIAVALFLVHAASGATRKPAATERGAGAKALISKAKAVSLPPVPPDIVLPPPAARYFFAATATDSKGLTSDRSSEASTTNRLPVRLAWTPGVGTNVITNFTVWRGASSRAYTRSWPAGTNCVLSVPPPAPTNVVVTIAGVGFLLSLTNPTGFRTFKGQQMTISKRYQ